MPNPSAAARPRNSTRAKRKEPVSSLKASAPSAEEEISRLRGVIERLQSDRRGAETDTAHVDFTLTAELRWKINQLEKEKLQLTCRHNEEVSRCEAQVARLRAQVERVEAQRQTLEYDVAVVRRDAAVERRNAEEKMSDLTKHNHKLDVLSAELRQRVSDLQRSLEITQQAREDDLQGLQAELHERDRLLLSSSAEHERLREEKSRLETLTQEQNDTLHQLKCELERMRRDGESDTEKLKLKSTELKRSVAREQKLRSDLEAALQKMKVLEQTIECERTAHLQSKFNSEIIQMRMRDLEGSLEVEKIAHAEVSSALELWKQKSAELEKAFALERDKSEDSSQKLSQMEREFLSMKTDLTAQLDRERAESAQLIGRLEQEKAESAQLIGRLEQEKAESAELSVKLQEQMWRERQQEVSRVQEALVCVQESYDALLSDLDQVLQQFQQQGATHTHSTGEGRKHNASAVMDVLRRTLHYYSTQLQESLMVMQKLNHEIRQKDKTITDLQMNIQECEARGACVNEETKRLRVCVADAASDLRRLTQQLQEEKSQHTHTQAQMNTLRQQLHADAQEKLTFLHTLYQRLIAGCVLVSPPPHSMLGSFSWAELSALVQEHVDTLTSDLSTATQKVSYLESVCEGKAAALESVSAQLKQREESWSKQREDLNTQHTHLNKELQLKIQAVRGQVERAEGRVCALEAEAARLQELVSACGREGVCLLAACALLAGSVCGLRRRVCELAWQKAVLQERVCDAELLRSEVARLLLALGDGEVKGQGTRRFRRGVIAVMAAARMRALGRRSALMFTVDVGLGAHVCVEELEITQGDQEGDALGDGSRLMKTLTSSELLVLIHTCMEKLQQEMSRTDCVRDSAGLASAAQSGYRRLLERLLSRVDSQCCGHHGKDALSRRLGDGLLALTSEHTHGDNKTMMASLQKHILDFTQRLHSAEVERRELRLEISRIKHSCKDTHTACVPLQQFEGVCEELSSALQRELRAQALLHDQASQLQQLGLSMELHTGDELEKERTLAQAVQSLSDAKLELRRKDQSLRSLGKRLSQSQQENRQLQQNISSAENRLYTAAVDKECLMSYMKSVEQRMKEMKDEIILSKNASALDEFARQLSRMTLVPPDSQSIMGNPEMDACQRLVMRFLELNQACCKISSPEKDVSSFESHIAALRSELQEKHYLPLSASAEDDHGMCFMKGSSRNTLSELQRTKH